MIRLKIMVRAIIFDYDETLTTENSITFLVKWQIRRYFESEKFFNPFKGFLYLVRIFFYGLRYERHLRTLFSKKNHNKPINFIINKYGKYVSKYYPYILRGLKSSTKSELAKSSKLIPLKPKLKEFLLQLKNNNILIGICSMSIEIAVITSLSFVKLDYVACNNLIYFKKYIGKESVSITTGDSMLNIRDAHDKKNMVLHFSKIHNIPLNEIIYVGDDFHDFLAADVSGLGLIILNPKKLNRKNIVFYKKGKDHYNFKIIRNITDVLRYLNT